MTGLMKSERITTYGVHLLVKGIRTYIYISSNTASELVWSSEGKSIEQQTLLNFNEQKGKTKKGFF